MSNTREVFPFVLVSEGSVAAGTRRVEAVAGFAGARHLQAKAQTLREVADHLSTTPAKVVERVTKMQKQVKQLESRAQALGDALATLPSAPIVEGPLFGTVGAPQVALHVLDVAGVGDVSKILKRRAEFLAKQAAPDMVLLLVLGSQIACFTNAASKVHAGELLQQLVKPLGGRGGGNARFAQGSVPAELDPLVIARRVQNRVE